MFGMDTFYTGRFILIFILYDSMHLQPLANHHKQAEIIIRNMPRELRQELKIQAAKEGESMTEIIIRLIINYLQEKRKEGGAI